MASGNDFTPAMAERNDDWNKGYSAGYRGQPFDPDMADSIPYCEAFEVGKSDRVEDEEAMESGDFDGMSESEREAIYGDESP